MKLQFEHNYQQKYLEISFTEQTTIANEDDVLQWRQAWLKGLSSWHSPYKAIINGDNLIIAAAEGQDLKGAFARMEKLLSGFFLKTAVIYGLDPSVADLLPFAVAKDRDDAFQRVGIRTVKPRQPGDFRSSIQIQNHFQQHVMEISFSEPAVVSSREQLNVLKDKITNNLMQWHSAWNLLVDCHNLEIDSSLNADFERILTFFKGFFLKEVLGYSPKSKESRYPFKVYRSRHNAAGRLENEGNISGSDANCQSRK